MVKTRQSSFMMDAAMTDETGDVEMAGMTMTLVVHMRMMSSIVL